MMKRSTILGLASALLWLLPQMGWAAAEAEPAQSATAEQSEAKVEDNSTADHTKFEELDKNFATGPDVTSACLECHTEAAKQLHKTKHWTWDWTNPVTGQRLGKNNVINNFCTSTKSNKAACTACHIGYGWKSEEFDFTQEDAVDCLVCHDTTGKYKKIPGLAGHPNYKMMEWPPKSGNFREPTDLKEIAQNVGKTSRKTCGTCHFYGGGGNAVKHGDLDSSLNNPRKYLDIHMEADGNNFTCATCHMTEGHQVSGSRYAPTAADTDGQRLVGQPLDGQATTCADCHGNTPHKNDEGVVDAKSERLNVHTRKIACQSCHIPAFARGPLHTKTTWDWSTAGELDDEGNRIKIKGSEGRAIYDSNKGHFTYERWVIPEYKWFNGNVKYTLFGDKVDGSEVVKINEFLGSPDDPDSRIWPVRVFRGKQPYDVGNQTLAVFHTAGKDETAFWGNYDWEAALETGMRAAGVEFSGEYDFVETEMSWPITHMVAPKYDALACDQCHRENGRFEDVPGVYMPARDRSAFIDTVGSALALLTLFGVFIHGGIRIIMSRRRG